MAVQVSYPGVYIEEVPSGVRTIVGVATSITAFVGRARRGPTDQEEQSPVRVQSYAEFERVFGGLWEESMMSYAVEQYFQNGGKDALIIRVVNGGAKATITLPASGDSLTLEAASTGDWGDRLRAVVDHQTRDFDAAAPDADLFNLTIEELDETGTTVVNTEPFLNVSRDEDAPRFVTKVLEQESNLVRVQGAVPAARPDEGTQNSNGDGDDGSDITETEVTGSAATKTGIYSLERADLFNLMVIPPFTRGTAVADSAGGKALLSDALAYCKGRRAILLVDPPSAWNEASDVTGASGVDSLGLRDRNAAIYFPQIKVSDAMKDHRLESFAPSGAVAGIIARIDSERGFWKASAGQEARLFGVQELSVKLTDGENGQLNPLGVNCLRSFPIVGNVVWGARTLDGADRLASEWKYLPVRRVALYIEESLYRGTQWAVFEPNDEPLWAQLRLNVGAFMHNLFRQGAFQGLTPKEAYYVKCDTETTTQNDINMGIVNIHVGFAPLKPAEFVVIKIQQMAGQVEA